MDVLVLRIPGQAHSVSLSSAFHQELAQVAQQAGLQIDLAVTLGQVEEIGQVAVLEDAGRILGQKSRQCCEFLVRQDTLSPATVPKA